MDTLTLDANLDALTTSWKYINAAALDAALNKKQIYHLRLAIDEILTNIVTHGYEEAHLAGKIWLWAECTEHALTVYTEDNGVQFDPLDAPPPGDLNRPLAERAIGGLGVFLAFRSVDEFRYEYVSGRNRNIFVVYRNHTVG